MPVRVNFVIGHISVLRKEPTVNGFTHDWQIFIEGSNSADIQHYVEKVVFNLHETFPYPRRVVMQPPYKLGESGYGSFILPIDIYLRNSDEPKKITFIYDLTLQMNGPVIKTQKEKYYFNNPNKEFCELLLKGGGQITLNSSSTNNLLNPSSSNSHSEEEEDQDNVEQIPPNELLGLSYEDYVDMLHEIKHRILTTEDDSELGRVVQVIMPTGHYELTDTTFDFNLFELDGNTARKLQELLLSSRNINN